MAMLEKPRAERLWRPWRSACLPFCIICAVCGMGPIRAAAVEKGGRAPALRVFAGIPPVAYFADRVGGDRVRVETLLRPGQEPHNFELTPRQMARLANADLFLAIGFPFERRLAAKAASVAPRLEVVDVSEGIPRRRMRSGTHHHHGHAEHEKEGHVDAAHTHAGEGESEGEHGEDHGEHGMLDPHVWLSPLNAVRIVENIRKAFARRRPGDAAVFARNARAVTGELRALDQEIRKALAPVRGRSILVFHPAFGYFADAYGLTQIPVELEGKEPSARRLAELMDRARREHIRVVFVQPQFSSRTARVIARAIHGAVVPLDPLARDYIANLRGMAARIREGLLRNR